MVFFQELPWGSNTMILALLSIFHNISGMLRLVEYPYQRPNFCYRLKIDHKEKYLMNLASGATVKCHLKSENASQ